ncbi:MAG: TolC family outer membrane protein [Rhodobacterales bacterium]|nr:TolC family outer membrane protein [Rhodobacterales bacterium]
MLVLTWATPGRAADLAHELADLLRDHPQIRAESKGVDSSREGVNRTFSDYLPRVRVTGDIGPESVDNPTTRGRGPDPYRRLSSAGGISVTQNLFNGFATSSAMRSAELGVEIARLTLEGTQQQVLFEGIRAYLDVLRQQRLITLSRRNEQTIQRQLNLEDARVQRGSGIAVDVLQAKSRLQLARERRITFEGALADAVTRYTQVYGHAPDLAAMVDPQPPVAEIPPTLDAATDVALEENPSVSNAGSQTEAARERKRAVRSEYYPSLDLVGEANYEKDKDAVRGTRRDYSVLLKAEWDLFTGLSTRAGVAQATHDYLARKDREELVRRKVIEQVGLAWQALLTARDRLDLLDNAVNIATAVHDSRKKLREAGKETVINVLDAENEIFNAEINYTAAAYDERSAVYQLLLSMGRLTATRLDLPAPSDG